MVGNNNVYQFRYYIILWCSGAMEQQRRKEKYVVSLNWLVNIFVYYYTRCILVHYNFPLAPSKRRKCINQMEQWILKICVHLLPHLFNVPAITVFRTALCPSLSLAQCQNKMILLQFYSNGFSVAPKIHLCKKVSPRPYLLCAI